MTKRKNNENELKIKIWEIVNFVIIMLAGIFFAVESEVIGIAHVASQALNQETEVFNLTVDIVKNSNKVMNKAIILSVGLYAVIQIVNYCLYKFKVKKVLIICVVLEILLSVSELIYSGNFFLAGIPVISALIYLRILKLEGK